MVSVVFSSADANHAMLSTIATASTRENNFFMPWFLLLNLYLNGLIPVRSGFERTSFSLTILLTIHRLGSLYL